MTPLNDDPLDLSPLERRLILTLRSLSHEEQLLLVATIDAVLDREAPEVIVTGFRETLAALRASRKQLPLSQTSGELDA